MTRRQETYLRLFMLMGVLMIAMLIYLGSQWIEDKVPAILKTMNDIQGVLIWILLVLILIPALICLVIYFGTVRDSDNNWNPMTK